MSKVAVVYFSNTGNTEAIAELVAEGAREAGAEVDVFSVDDFDVNSADDYDAFALGCPAGFRADAQRGTSRVTVFARVV